MNLTAYALQYLYIGLYLCAAAAFAFICVGIGWLLAPRKSSPLKRTHYECGAVLGGEPWSQFKIQYYIYALLFVVFDVEAVFLFPWAVVFKAAGVRGFTEMMIFVGVLVVGLVVAWRSKALEWE